MNARLKQLLSHLAATLDPEQEREIATRHQSTLRFEPVDRPPLIATYPFPPDSPWQPFPHHEVFADPEKMLFNELVSAWGTSIVHRAQVGDDLPATVRAGDHELVVALASRAGQAWGIFLRLQQTTPHQALPALQC